MSPTLILEDISNTLLDEALVWATHSETIHALCLELGFFCPPLICQSVPDQLDLGRLHHQSQFGVMAPCLLGATLPKAQPAFLRFCCKKSMTFTNSAHTNLSNGHMLLAANGRQHSRKRAGYSTRSVVCGERDKLVRHLLSVHGVRGILSL